MLGTGFPFENRCNGSTHKCSWEWNIRMQEIYRKLGNLVTTTTKCNSKLEMNVSHPWKIMLSTQKLSFLGVLRELYPLTLVQKEWTLFHKTPEVDDELCPQGILWLGTSDSLTVSFYNFFKRLIVMCNSLKIYSTVWGEKKSNTFVCVQCYILVLKSGYLHENSG